MGCLGASWAPGLYHPGEGRGPIGKVVVTARGASSSPSPDWAPAFAGVEKEGGVKTDKVLGVWCVPVFSILPRQGEVAGPCQTEGEERDNPCSVSSPSVTFGATSPWRGRIDRPDLIS